MANFYNPINYPDLPYDRLTCEHLCVSKYWAIDRNCSCFMYTEARIYSNATHVPMCATYDEAFPECTLSNAKYNTPDDVYQNCACYDKCSDYCKNVNFCAVYEYFYLYPAKDSGTGHSKVTRNAQIFECIKTKLRENGRFYSTFSVWSLKKRIITV